MKAIKTYIRTKSGRLIERIIFLSEEDYEAFKEGKNVADILKKVCTFIYRHRPCVIAVVVVVFVIFVVFVAPGGGVAAIGLVVIAAFLLFFFFSSSSSRCCCWNDRHIAYAYSCPCVRRTELFPQ